MTPSGDCKDRKKSGRIGSFCKSIHFLSVGYRKFLEKSQQRNGFLSEFSLGELNISLTRTVNRFDW